ncbi:MAG: hypothetical protein Q8Q60_00215 [Candidatus Chromulinivorax sp.]|nr:hypothetical protein [Candidatus Chromulinivorax sp.]
MKKVILTLHLLAPMFLHAMDRRETTQYQNEQNASCCQQLQQTAQNARQVAQEAAVGCCITAPFWVSAAMASGTATYAMCSCMRADHGNDDKLIPYTLFGAAAGTVAFAWLITCSSMNDRYEKLKKL